MARCLHIPLMLLLVGLCHAREGPVLFGKPLNVEAPLVQLNSTVPNSTVHRRSLAPARGDGFWSVKGTDFVDALGNVVRFSGVLWSGFETELAVLGGLDVRPLDDFMDQMKDLGFNLIRLPFAGDTLKPTTHPDLAKISANPQFKNLSSLEIMDAVIDASTKRGIKVILDYHRLRLTILNEVGFWWDDRIPESVWLKNWAMLAKRYKGNPTIVGADLFNEIHPVVAPFDLNTTSPDGSPFWVKDAGPNEAYNFRRASLAAIAAIHAEEPNWIITMEGMWNDYWWGGNCAKLLEAPITEPADKLAYSAHDYGPVVYDVPWFNTPEFPKNLPELYYKNWGIIVEKGYGALWIGEFGSPYPPPTSELNRKERVVFENQIAFIKKINVSWTLAFWGPDTKDTGSVLGADWISVYEEKMKMLQPIMHPGFV